MIRGMCHTTQDNVTCPVIRFAAVPRQGEYVAVKYKGNDSYSKVVKVVHTMDQSDGTPFIEVELWNQKFNERN